MRHPLPLRCFSTFEQRKHRALSELLTALCPALPTPSCLSMSLRPGFALHWTHLLLLTIFNDALLAGALTPLDPRICLHGALRSFATPLVMWQS